MLSISQNRRLVFIFMTMSCWISHQVIWILISRVVYPCFLFIFIWFGPFPSLPGWSQKPPHCPLGLHLSPLWTILHTAAKTEPPPHKSVVIIHCNLCLMSNAWAPQGGIGDPPCLVVPAGPWWIFVESTEQNFPSDLQFSLCPTFQMFYWPLPELSLSWLINLFVYSFLKNVHLLELFLGPLPLCFLPVEILSTL